MNLCPYKNKPCDLWDEECLAAHPGDCPYCTGKDVAAVMEWQARQIINEKE